ncbi:hypothetical protein [Globicatella sp. PHS-GS-PNBC-21-1553]|uniref:hypothetical protein n=1 Tax=Globicatella sp. PHS-GS-PNBC-21-1553 TaxID=2885764 RepID=UPI00298EF6EE|nr:hypothetical protein [Globicatella sp. PHS-GS-PNBC-21-1553]WPC07740.1 hypothetical protein LB888_06535 [Globicatella sp. PHS-GS-PNBC-21-1553]
MENGCIYCGITEDLSKSDIIPDALTNAKIINPNVCRIEHNNKFSDMFEDEVIKKLALITNELDIKSSKGKRYASYEAIITVGDTDYNTKMSSETELFGGNKKMRSVDGKSLLGPIDEIKKIKAADDTNVSEIDVNQIEIEKRVSLDLSVFFSKAMFRMVAKIAFEWYCAKNKVNLKKDEFATIIDFITSNKGERIVSIVSNPEIYALFNNTVKFGSHALLSYVAHDNSINVIIDLFGIAIYNVRVCDLPLDDCKNNVIFQELSLDAKHISFEDTDIESFQEHFINSFEQKNIGLGLTAMIPKDMTDNTLQYKLLYVTNYKLFLEKLNLIAEPTQEVITLILNNIQKLLQESVITIRGLKRFVKEHQKHFEEGIRLNPKGTNKKSIFMFYMLFIIGQSNGQIKSMHDLYRVLKRKFASDTININDELSSKLHEEMLAVESNSELIKEGAKIIEGWGFE